MKRFKVYWQDSVTSPLEYVGTRHKHIFIMPLSTAMEIGDYFRIPYKVFEKLVKMGVTQIKIVKVNECTWVSSESDWKKYGRLINRHIRLDKRWMGVSYDPKYLGERVEGLYKQVAVQSSLL